MKNREKEKRDRKRKQEQSRLETKRRLEHVLSALGLLEGFRALPAGSREEAIQSLPSRPEVRVDPAATEHPGVRALKVEIGQVLEEARVWTADGKPVPLLDFFSICPVLPTGFSSLGECLRSREQRLFVKEAAATAYPFLRENLRPAQGLISGGFMVRLMARSRMDEELFGCVVEEPKARPGKPMFRLIISRSAPREERVEIDGHVRRAYQCGLPGWSEGITWLECDGEVLGLDKGRRYPFFIQPHALHRLRERLPRDLLADGVLQLGVLESLVELRVVQRQGDSYWFEFHLAGHRVGYLIARVAEGKVVITTFLFLTMHGTPEFRLLSARLGLTSRDIEYEGLDRLETFLSPDVRDDPQLAAALEECGCGSLLELARQVYPNGPLQGRVEELKRFLRITDAEEDKLFNLFSPLAARSA